MKSLTSTALAALLAVSIVVPSLSSPAEARRGRGVAVGAGVALGILGAAAIVGSNRAYADDRGYRDDGYSYRDQCRSWNYRCDRGNDWACEKFDRNC